MSESRVSIDLKSGPRGESGRGEENAVAISGQQQLRQQVQQLLAQELNYFVGDEYTSQPLTDEQLIAATEQLMSRLEAQPESIPRGELLPSHLVRLCETPLLAPADEYSLFLHYNWLKYRASELRERLSAQRPAVGRLTTARKMVELAGRCENFLVCANARLVISIVKHFVDMRHGFDDLLSDGMMALMRSVQKFDFSRGFRFSTYATMVVRRHVCRQIKLLQKQRSRFVTGTLEEMSPEEVIDQRSDFAGQATSAPVAHQISELLGTLDDREQFIIRRRFAFDESPRKQTLSYLAAELGVCKERVRQLEQRALRKLRSLAHDSGLRQLAGI